MDNMFNPRSLTVKQIFTDSDGFYKIPRYQRPYRWTDEQVDKLWEDIYESYKENLQNYFLGSIILASENTQGAYWDVVDGQQRITTLTILLCVIRDLFPNINNNEGLPDPRNIDSKTIQNSIFYNEQANRLKLYTHAQHQSDFSSLITNNDTNNLGRPYKYQVFSDEEPKYKFINTTVIFRERLLEIGEEEAGKLINYLFNNVYIIRIDCSTTEFAIRMFQVLNDRGMDLTNADLIKSYLFDAIGQGTQDKEQQIQDENTFISTWQEIEHFINDVDISLNDMLVIYEYYLLAYNPKKSLYDELLKKFKGSDPLHEIAQLKKFVTLYKEHLFDTSNPVIYSLWYLRWARYWKAILCTALQEEYPSYDELTVTLRRFYYLYWIAGKTLTKIKQISFNIIKWTKEGQSIEFIKNKIEEKIDADKIISLALEAISSKNVYYAPWFKPVLLMVEYNQTDATSPFIPMDRNLHIEHILPSQWFEFDEWRNHITEEIANNYLNSIGNLTLLSGRKNIEASNNPFSTKINVYNGKGKYHVSNEKITSFSITQRILNEYENGKFNKMWNEDAIKERWNWFLDELEEILNIDTSKIKKQ